MRPDSRRKPALDGPGPVRLADAIDRPPEAPVPSPPPVTPGSGDAARSRVPPECVICETPMEPTAPDHWMCQECRSQCYIPGGSHRIVSSGIGESDQVDLPGMQAKDGGRRT